MATTYTELKTEIQSELDFNNPNLIASIPNFIHRAERRFNRNLRVLPMECRSSHEAVPVGTADPDKGVYALPADFLDARTIEFRDDNKVYMVYNRAIPQLSDSNPTNWLLDNHDDLYLYASLAYAEPWLKNDERIKLWATMAEGILDEIRIDDQSAKYQGSDRRQRVGYERLYHGRKHGFGQYEFLSPRQFFDLEQDQYPPRTYGYSPGVFTISENNLRILPRPSSAESGTAGWSTCQ